jgi:tetratricopeptide (TPR) repeat protein
LLEIGLRVASVGTPSELFLPAEGDPDYLLTNPNFAGVYFVPGHARTMKVRYIRRQKRPETYRIFVLGGSAAVGYPENRTGFSRKLEVLLRRTFPDLEIEVVNLATAAINSYVVWDIAQHSIEYDPDLFLVYLGNTEVIGPFGPLQKTPLPIEDVDSICALVSVKRLRLAQLVARWTSGGAGSRWRGMQAFMGDPMRASDPRLRTVYANFRRNLEDIRMLAHETGTAIVFGSVVTRLVDFAPFASAHREDLGDADLGRWRRHYEIGSAHLAQGDFDAAASEFEAALRVDAQHADTHFRLGRAYQASGDRDRGEAAFVSARDLDTLRFRADSTINASIEAVASDDATARVGFVDVVDATPDELMGDELLLDHVHFSSAGNDWLARTFYGAVVEIISNERSARPTPVSMTREALSNAVFDVPPVRISGLKNLEEVGVKAALYGTFREPCPRCEAQAADRWPALHTLPAHGRAETLARGGAGQLRESLARPGVPGERAGGGRGRRRRGGLRAEPGVGA